MAHTRSALTRFPGVDTTLYLITDTAQCRAAGRSVAETVAAAIRGGVGMVQIRDKHMGETEFQALATDVLFAVETVRDEINMFEPIPVFLNDRVTVAERLLDHGHQVHVHVGQSDMSVERVRQMIGTDPMVGLSASNGEEIAAGQAAGGIDLFGIGPVWDTTTKTDARAALGVDGFAELVATSQIPAFAIGGITPERATELRDSGTAGICVVSAICAAPDPEAAARNLWEALRGETRDED